MAILMQFIDLLGFLVTQVSIVTGGEGILFSCFSYVRGGCGDSSTNKMCSKPVKNRYLYTDCLLQFMNELD